MLYTIYQVTHLESGKTYIGKHQTLDLNDGYMGSGKYIRRAINRYGLDGFDKTILHVFDNEAEMNAKEAELVTKEFCLREDTYNLCPGGQGGWGYINSIEIDRTERNRKGGKSSGSKLSSEHMRKIGSKQPKEAKEIACRNGGLVAMKGKKHRQDTIEKMSMAQIGKLNSQYGSMWVTNGSDNKKISRNNFIESGWYPGRTLK